MANFARGLEAGLPLGLAFGEAARERRERRAYQEAAQQWTPEETELNLGDAPISGGASPMARGIGPQVSQEQRQQLESQRLAAPREAQPRSQTQRRFTLPGAPGETYRTQAEARSAAMIPGMEAQWQTALQLGDVDRANELSGELQSMQQRAQRTQILQAREEREQAAYDEGLEDRSLTESFLRDNADLYGRELMQAAVRTGNNEVINSATSLAATQLGMSVDEARLESLAMERDALAEAKEDQTAYRNFFADNRGLASEDPEEFQRLAAETGNSFVASEAQEYVSSGLSVQEQQARLDSAAVRTRVEEIALEEDLLAQAEEKRIKEEYPNDPEAQMQARLNSENWTVRAAALALQNDQQTVESNQLVLEAERRVAAVNKADRAFRESGGTDFNVFFDSLNIGGGSVSLLPAETESGRQYYTLGRDTNGDGEYDEVLNYQGASLEGLYQDVLTKNAGVAATVERDLAANREIAKALSPTEREGMIDSATESVQDVLMTELKGSSYMTLPEGMSEAQFMEQVDKLQLGTVASAVLEDMQAGVANGRYNSAVDSQNLAMRLAKLEYDPETDTFYIPSISNPEEIIIAEVFNEGSEARQAAIGAYAKAQEEQAQRDRATADRTLGPGGLSGPAASREAQGESFARGVQDRREQLVPQSYPRPGAQAPGFGVPPGLAEWWTGEVYPEQEQNLRDGGPVRRGGPGVDTPSAPPKRDEASRQDWRDSAAAGLRASRTAQSAQRGGATANVPLAYRPLEETSAMDRLRRSQVQAPRNMSNGGLARKDMRGGGDVDGPGTETSDSIPARLSDGEYVLNAETVKMVGEDFLDRINKEGLRRRDSRKRK